MHFGNHQDCTCEICFLGQPHPNCDCSTCQYRRDRLNIIGQYANDVRNELLQDMETQRSPSPGRMIARVRSLTSGSGVSGSSPHSRLRRTQTSGSSASEEMEQRLSELGTQSLPAAYAGFVTRGASSDRGSSLDQTFRPPTRPSTFDTLRQSTLGREQSLQEYRISDEDQDEEDAQRAARAASSGKRKSWNPFTRRKKR